MRTSMLVVRAVWVAVSLGCSSSDPLPPHRLTGATSSTGGDGAAGASGETGGGGTTSAGGGEGGSGGERGSVGTGGDVAAVGNGGSGGGVIVPHGDIVATIERVDLQIDCSSNRPADPVSGSIEISYSNRSSEDAEATITSASVVLRTEVPLPWTFDVTPDTSGTVGAGSVESVVHTKVDGSGEGEGDPCDFCDGMWTVEVTWEVNGAGDESVSAPQSVKCLE